MGSACQLLNRNTCKPLRVHFEFFSLSKGGKQDTGREGERQRQTSTGRENLGFSFHFKVGRRSKMNGDNRKRDIDRKTGKAKRDWGLWLVGRIMACTDSTMLVLSIFSSPLPHLSNGLAGSSLNWVPMATARLAARATLFPDAVWKWQGSQKATSERWVSVRVSVCLTVLLSKSISQYQRHWILLVFSVDQM